MSPSATVDLRSIRVVIASGVSTTLAILPVALIGALAPIMRIEGALTQSRLGLAVAGYFTTAAVVSFAGGRLSERVGAIVVMGSAAVVSGSCLVGLAVTGHRPVWLFAWMMLAGAANGVAQPAGNVALAGHVMDRAKGTSFGVKLAAVPLAGLLAGAAVPILGLTFGWRWAMVSGSVLLAAYFASMPADVGGKGRARQARYSWSGLPLSWLLMGTTAALGSAAGNAMQVFYVSSAVDGGIDAGTAGILLAFGSGVGILARVFWGWVGGRPGVRAKPVLAGLFFGGALSFALLGLADDVPLLAGATVFAFATGWAWAGLLLYAVVEDSPGQPGSATGVVMTGVWIGGIVGPATFGGLAGNVSFVAAWLAAALMLLMGGLCVLLPRNRPAVS